MKNFLHAAALAICAIFMVANVSAQDNYNATTMGEKVYLETANWGQNSPFNKQIFTSYGGSTNAKAGCVPTAYAIVMRYHEFPTEGTSKTLYNCQASTYVEITDRVYDFSKMPLTNGSGWTEEQQTEVSKFFSHVLHACFPSSIGTGATTVNEGQTSKVLNDYFNYQLINASYQANFTMEQWAEKLRESISNGCPVPYAANNSGTGDTRHMFVVDGYTTGGYFHFNFGWSGSGNGWFKLDNITPSQGDNYSWNGNSQHYALFNLAPNKTPRTVTATANPSSMGTVSINGGTAGSSVSAEVIEGTKATLTAHPADGYALANWTKNGVVVGTKNPIQVTVSESGNDYVANFDDAANVQIEKTCTFKISDVTTSGVNGSYCSTWTTSDGIVLSCTKGSEPAYALSTTVNTFFAKAPVGNSETLVSDITYTLTAPAGYIIKSYSFKGNSPSSSYTINVTVGGNTTNVTNASAGVVISASDINAQSTSFVLGSTYTGRAGLSIMEDGVTVTIQSEGGASTPEPTPTTYTVTTTANPAEGGTAKFAVGTGSQKTQGDVENGTQITLYATANTGYNFVNWTLNDAVVGTSATCNVSVSQTANYVANFEANTPAEPTTSLAGKFFRIKVKNTSNYMNIANTSDNTGATSGITVVAKNESSDTQIFLFEQSGDGYKLKANSGNYIKCHAWNANANTTSANDATVLTFETTGNELEYLIKWDNTNMNNGVERDDYFKAENGYVYCDAASTAAATWVLEEVIPSNEKTLTVTFAGASWVNEASSWWEYVVTQNTPAVTVKAANSAKAIGYSTVNSVRHPYLLDGNSFTISLPANCKIVGYTLRYKGHNLNTQTFTYTGNNGTTATETVGQDGVEKTLTVTGLENNEIAISVSDQSSQAGVVIVALEITYIEKEFTPLPFKAEIEGWRNDNPNTHLGTITIGGTPMKLTPEHLTASELTMPLGEGTTLAFTRKYRGFEFQGFYIGSTSLGENPTLTAENIAAINENTPLVAKFTATDDVTLFYDDDEFSYRIPAIAKTGNGMLVAVSDYRHNLDDIGRDNHGTGTKRIDLVMRTSTDNGATWSETKTIAAGDNSKAGSYLRAFGDAAIAAVGQNIVVMAAAGDVVYTAGTTSSPNKMARIYSTDNGATWTIEEMTTKMYSQSTSLIPSGGSAFFGSGKLAVDPNFNGTGNARIYGALLVRIGTDGYNNFGVFSDDLGATWKILGGDNTNPVAKGDEPKVEILPNGQILLSARRGGGRVFRVFTYGDDKANGAGSWGDAAVNGCDNGGSNATNGEIICLDAKKPNGKPTKILLQSQPKGGSGQYDRYNVTIWYKEVSADETYTPSSIASGWTQGLEVSPADVKSAYSAMCLQENGKIAFFFEEAPCYGDDHTKGYSMVYVPLTIEEITNNNFLNPNADVEYVPVEFNIELTDTEGNTYRETLDYVPNDAAAVATYLTTTYPFITLGKNGAIADNTYTNTVTLPFKVSNANTTVWHNIYWPANDTSAGKYYPIYLLSTAEGDTYVAKKTETKHYGESSYNTLNWADELSWAVYSVDGTLNFKFKNKLTGKFMAVNGVVSSGNADNVIYTDEANATTFTLEKYTGTNTYYGNYAIKSVYNGTTGYVCNTSVGHANATNYTGKNHAGAWAKFVEAPDYQAIIDALKANVAKFGAGDGNYTDNNDINAIKAIIENIGTTPLNTLNTHTETVQNVKDSYSEITLTVPVANSGSVKIKDEAVSNKFVQKGEVTIEAVPAAGYRFVNWTKPAAQAGAAARTAEARNAVEVVSADNPYTFNLTDAVSLEANFEQIVVTATLTDGQGNQYIVKLDGFTNGVTKEAVAAKLVEKYPYITLGTEATGITLEGGDAAYTYTNTVTLPFKVTSTSDIWHNIYYPSNGGNPNYIAALNEDEVVDMAASKDYAYGDNPTYNTKDGGNSICWAIYNVNNSFEFIFKSRVTGKYIKVESVSSETTENVKFVENAEDATVFTLLVDTGTYNGDYALVANVEDTTGYLCATSSSKSFVTHYNGNGHQGAWVKFVEAPDYNSMSMDIGIVLGYFFGAGDGKCVIAGTEIEEINTAMQNSGSITLNSLKAYAATLDNAMSNDDAWHDVALTVAPGETGTAIIQLENDDPALTRKRVPTNYELTIVANPAEGYHFVNWTNGPETISETNTYTFNVTAATTLTANFEKNTYTINVSTNGTGGSAMIGTGTSATVEHGNEVTLTAVANDGYRFVNWTKGTEIVSADANYTFTATADGEYVANFELANTCRVEFNCNYKFGYINVYNADGTERIGGTYDAVVEVGTTIQMVATPVNNNYRFTNWTDGIGGNVLSSANPYVFTVENDITLYANFEPAYYILTVSSSPATAGTVSATSGTTTGTTVNVGRNMEATITATANSGYEFISWTLDGEVVSTNTTYTIAAIDDFEKMVDVEYVANFNKIENATAGTYYRIGYDFPTAANAGAARAAGDVQTLTISTSTGDIAAGGKNCVWNYTVDNNPAGLKIVATDASGKRVNAISATTGDASKLKFSAGGAIEGTETTSSAPTTFTVSVNENYLITGYSMTYTASSASRVTISNTYGYSVTPTSRTEPQTMEKTDISEQAITFNVSAAASPASYAAQVSSFTVTIKQIGGEGSGGEGEGSGETPETANRYYMQSVASGVANKANALLMTQETGATSIFYYADSKLLSYDKGTYVKEDGTTRGLQAVGTSGTVTITTTGETSTIAAPSYLHAVDGTTRYVDHCGSNPDNHAANHNFVLEEVTTLPVTISAALHATFYAPVAVTIPEGVKAYVLKEKNITAGDYVTMTSLQNGIIPANTGVILKSEEAKTYNFDITEDTDEAKVEAEGNVLEGTVAKSYVNKDAYMLAKKNNKIGLYPLSNNSHITGGATATFTNNSHKAYLPVEGNFAEVLKRSNGFHFVFDDGETTGIDEVETENADTIYDLQGRKLSEITEPGIYIVNGKKIFVK